MERHAYMIMAHHRPDLLQLLITALDDERNDIIIHIDQKSDMQQDCFYSKRSPLYFIERMNVNWGGYTQVECEYRLMKKALSIGTHSYYHFLTGANFPLWNQNYIHQFFKDHDGYEFIGFDHGADFSLRVKYFVPFAEHGKLIGVSGRIIQVIRLLFYMVQDFFNIDRRKQTKYEIKKGCAYFSVTENFVKMIIEHEDEMKKLLTNTIWCDEVFVQTLAYNSEYKNRIFNMDNEFDGCMRELAWPSNVAGNHPGWNYSMKDIKHLLESKRLFAMKFESVDGLLLIKKIKEKKEIL